MFGNLSYLVAYHVSENMRHLVNSTDKHKIHPCQERYNRSHIPLGRDILNFIQFLGYSDLGC